LKRNIFDAHIHLDQYNQEQIDLRIEQWQQAGVVGVIAVSTDLASSYRTLRLKQRYPQFVFAAIGFHPEQPLPSNQEIEELLSLLSIERKHISAIGEVGLPYYNKNNPNIISREADYEELLRRFSLTAKQNHLPLILHAVHDKAESALHIVNEMKVEKVHFHWLKAPQKIVQKIVESGYFISVTPEVCFKERDQKLALVIPEGQLLLETDGPWKYDYWKENMETTPILIRKSAEIIAQLQGKSSNAILDQTFQNALIFLEYKKAAKIII
jgi:TatD DNase family protein